VRIRIQQHQQCGIRDSTAHAARLGAPIHQHPETGRITAGPILQLHFRAVRAEPGHILKPQLRVVMAGQEPGAAQNGEAVAQRDESLHKSNQRAAIGVDIPIHPTDGVVLTIGIIIALLGAAKFVAGQ